MPPPRQQGTYASLYQCQQVDNTAETDITLKLCVLLSSSPYKEIQTEENGKF